MDSPRTAAGHSSVAFLDLLFVLLLSPSLSD